jgi:hypothetical protein
LAYVFISINSLKSNIPRSKKYKCFPLQMQYSTSRDIPTSKKYKWCSALYFWLPLIIFFWKDIILIRFSYIPINILHTRLSKLIKNIWPFSYPFCNTNISYVFVYGRSYKIIHIPYHLLMCRKQNVYALISLYHNIKCVNSCETCRAPNILFSTCLFLQLFPLFVQ